MSSPVSETKKNKKKENISVEEMYQKKTQVEHILIRPDTYIGSTEANPQVMWVLGEERFYQKKISFVPGLFKIFDEILVNAADNKTRDPKMKTIKINISPDGLISIFNDGKGIPITIHKKEKVYVPELIFGHLLTSSNYNDEEKKITGGRNGYGAKLCNIFSLSFSVETSDSNSNKIFKQVFSNNMSNKTEPVIIKPANGNYTKIEFYPDLSKFGMTSLDEDHFLLFQKRAYDLAGCLKGIDVFFNDKKININGFEEYVRLHFKEDIEIESTYAWAAPTERWEVCCATSEGQFQQVSFVNSINTYKGGTHVSYITDMIVSHIIEGMQKKQKKTAIKPFQVKPYIFVFINCLIENPAFDSQTKENMTLKSAKFGSKFTFTQQFTKRLMKLKIIENVLTWAQFKEEKLLKKTDGQKSARLTGIPKLDDASNAGTKKASDCTLILTEGDSAKTLAISGLSILGRANYGVFPLRGKLLNVRDALSKQVADNVELKSIKKILGLQQGVTYKNVESLRYGHIMMMTDQDHDGSHIKGLIINMIDHFWPSLLNINGFLLQFITPIVRCTRKNENIVFYTVPEYETWKEETKNQKGWKVKYYKGLGTSTAADARTYFSDLKTNQKSFLNIKEDERKLIDMAFSKKKANERKDWLSTYKQGTFMNYKEDEITYENFINKELILFSIADNLRSIPSVIDGLKIGQRKILYCCFKRNLRSEIKVAQLVGYIAEHSAYHHGEQSLASTIVGLAQNYVGSNNINILSPNGQFGTRIHGGSDSASSRYIFTSLEKITRSIFDSRDDPILKYLDEDGEIIEPVHYVPIIPMILINGAEGIGTGWRSFIPNYNPLDIIDHLLGMLDGIKDLEEIVPCYKGFRGRIEKTEEDKYKTFGVYKKIAKNKIEITELPIGTWTQNYKEFLEKLITGDDKTDALIKEYVEKHSESNVHFEIHLIPDRMKECLEDNSFETEFKLTSNLNTMNMVAFDQKGKLHRYISVKDIINEFYEVRLDFYQKRKEALINAVTKDLDLLENKARFITDVIEGRIVISKKKKIELEAILSEKEFKPIGKESSESFDYLLTMPLLSLTKEKVDNLIKEKNEKEKLLESLFSITTKGMWRTDLEILKKETISLGFENKKSKKRSFEEKPNRTEISASERLKNILKCKNMTEEEISDDSVFEE